MGKIASVSVYHRESQHENTSVTMESPAESCTNIGLDTLEGNVDVKIAYLKEQIFDLKRELAKEEKQRLADRVHHKKDLKGLQEQLSKRSTVGECECKNDIKVLQEHMKNSLTESKVLKEKLDRLSRELAHKGAGPSHRPNFVTRQAGNRLSAVGVSTQLSKFGRINGNAHSRPHGHSTPFQQPMRVPLYLKKKQKSYPPARQRSRLSDSAELSGNHLTNSTPDEASLRSPAQKRPIPAAPPANQASKRPKQMRPNPPQEVDDESENDGNVNDDLGQEARIMLNTTAHRLQSTSPSTSDESQMNNTLEEYGKGALETGMKCWRPQKISIEVKEKILRALTSVENMHTITMIKCVSSNEDSIWSGIVRKALPNVTDTKKLKDLVEFLATTSKKSKPFVAILKEIIERHQEFCRKCHKQANGK